MPDRIITPSNTKDSVWGNRLKLGVSAIYILAPIGILVARELQGESVDSLILLIVVMFMFASAYAIYGERTVDKATEKAKDVSGQEGDENGDSEGPEPQEKK